MFEFDFWYLGFLLPLPILFLLLSKKSTKTSLSLVVPFFSELDKATTLNNQTIRFSIESFLLVLAWSALILAVMKPVWIDEGIKLPIKGRDIMLAIDLSGSMKQQDFAINGRRSNRFNVVKVAAQSFIKARKHDRLGLVVFGTQAFLYAPLTFDKSLLLEYLSGAQINMAGSKTAIGDAIVLALKHFIDNKKQDDERRILVLLTDGENTAGRIGVPKATELAKEENIKIYTIGMGSKRFRRGIDEKSLKNIAKQTDGLYFHAHNTKGLYKIYKEIDRLEQKKVEEKTYRPSKDLFYYPLVAFLFFMSVLLLRKII